MVKFKVGSTVYSNRILYSPSNGKDVKVADKHHPLEIITFEANAEYEYLVKNKMYPSQDPFHVSESEITTEVPLVAMAG